MFKFALLGAATGVLGLLAVPASAQDTQEKKYDGFYVGGTIGYSVQNNDRDEFIMFDRDLDGTFGDTVVTTAPGAPNAFAPGFCGGRANGATPAAGCRKDRDGLEYSGRIGFDKQSGNFVVGVVGEIGKSRVRDSVTAFSSTPAAYTMNREIDWNAGLRLRAGYAAGGNTLFYGTGGAAYAKVKHSFDTTNTLNSFESRGKKDTWGWAAGGGVEQKLGGGVSLGLEYLYTRYNDKNHTVRAGAGTAGPNSPFVQAGVGTDFRRSDHRFDYHGIRTTLSFAF